ncbi:MAG: hypothetical protein EA393_04260 [Bacteroidetes bacterium]|nr:MAG: hypothetical protein EA393_04260 [Bacteroidota bacterium]
MKNYVNLFNSGAGYFLSGLFKMQTSKLPGLIIGLLLFIPLSCDGTEENPSLTDLEKAKMSFDSLLEDPENMVISFPDEDPGIPIYARVGPILNQFFVAGNQLVIPFYRNPECIPDSFNLLNYYDPPVAFGCELMVQGRFVIEKDAEEGQFPIMAHTTGSEVPIWIVDWTGFQSLRANGAITIVNLEELNPIKATALQFDEYLSPRINEHQVIIEAKGIVAGTDQKFLFQLTHQVDKIKAILLEIE